MGRLSSTSIRCLAARFSIGMSNGLTKTAARHAKQGAKDYTLPDYNGLALFVNTKGAMLGAWPRKTPRNRMLLTCNGSFRKVHVGAECYVP